VAVFDKFDSLEFSHRVNDIGYFALTMTDTGNDDRLNLFELDGQVEVWRSIPGLGVEPYIEFQGFHRALDIVTNTDGVTKVTSTGPDFNDLLGRRIVAYKEGTIRADKDAPAETAMKEYVEENCGITADSTVVGRLIVGGFPNFSVEVTSGGGPQWKGSRAFENVLDVLKDIAWQTQIDFAVIPAGKAEFAFRTYLDQFGSDRSVDSEDNQPVIFSIEFGYASAISYSYDRTDEANAVLVLGAGEKSLQETVTRYNDVHMAHSPWNQIEISRPGTAQEFTYQLEQLGDEILEDMKALEVIEFTPLQQGSQMYGLHYFLGDRVTARYRGLETIKRIIGIDIVVEETGERITLEVEDLP
jgi:hypothetical protein